MDRWDATLYTGGKLNGIWHLVQEKNNRVNRGYLGNNLILFVSFELCTCSENSMVGSRNSRLYKVILTCKLRNDLLAHRMQISSECHPVHPCHALYASSLLCLLRGLIIP